MKYDDIIAAPSVTDSQAAYGLWHQSHVGSMDDFYRFMTTPSPARTAWLESVPTEVRMIGSIAAEVITP